MISETVFNEKLNELRASIEDEVTKEFDTVTKEMKAMNVRVTDMETTIFELRNKVSDLEAPEATNNKLEQYTRRNSVRIYGIEDSVAETDEETCKKVQKLLNDKLRIKLSTGDFDIAHRLGEFRSDGIRVVICKFVHRLVKKQVLKARRALKGSIVMIREDLTMMNARLLEQASEHEKVKAVWSDEGRIIALLKNNKKFVVKRIQDLDKVFVDAKLLGPQCTVASAATSEDTPL